MRGSAKLFRLRRWCSSVPGPVSGPSPASASPSAAASPSDEVRKPRRSREDLRNLSFNPLISSNPIPSEAVSRYRKMSLSFEARELLGVLDTSIEEEDWNWRLRAWYGKLSVNIVAEVLDNSANADFTVFFFNWCDSHPEFTHTRYTLNHCLEALVKLGQTKRAHELLLSYGKPLKLNTFTYAALVRGYCRDGNVDRAFLMLGEMREKGLQPSVQVCNLVLKHLCDRGDQKRALDVIDDMVKHNREMNVFTYNMIIGTLCKMGKMKDAEMMVELMKLKGCTPDIVTMNSLIHCACRQPGGQSLKALGLLDEIVAKGYEPTTVTYTIVIDALVRGKRDAEAQTLLDQMHRRGVAFDTVTYNTLINRFCKAGMMDRAMQMFERMPSSGCMPDVVTFNTMIHGWCRAGDMDRARELFEKMKIMALSPNSRTYTTMIDGFFKAGKIQDAHGCLVEMRGKGNELFDAVTYVSLISSIAKLGKGFLAFQLLQEMIERGYTPGLLLNATVIDALKKSGSIEEVNKMTMMVRKAEMMEGPAFVVEDDGKAKKDAAVRNECKGSSE